MRCICIAYSVPAWLAYLAITQICIDVWNVGGGGEIAWVYLLYFLCAYMFLSLLMAVFDAVMGELRVVSNYVSKGMRAVKLCTNKILRFLTGGAG